MIVPHRHRFLGSEAWLRLDPRADGSAVSLAACGAASPAEVFTGSCDDLERHGTIELKCGRRSAMLLAGTKESVYLRLVGDRDAALVLDVNLQSATTAGPSALGMAVASSAEPLRSFGEARRDDGAANRRDGDLGRVGRVGDASLETSEHASEDHGVTGFDGVRREVGSLRRLEEQEAGADPKVNDAAQLFEHLEKLEKGRNMSLQIMNDIELNQPVEIGADQSVTLWSVEGASLDAMGERRVVRVREGNLSLENISLVNGRAESGQEGSDEDPGGGCLYARSATLHMQGGRIANCSSDRDGGGARIEGEGSTVSMQGVEIEDCKAEASKRTGSAGVSITGGGIMLRGGRSRAKRDEATLTSVKFRRNRAVSQNSWVSGGGLAVRQGDMNVTIRDALFEDCHVVSGRDSDSPGDWAYGGGLSVWSPGDLRIEDTNFTDTSAKTAYGQFPAFGGGIGVWQGEARLERVNFLSTRAYSSGDAATYAFGGGLGLFTGSRVPEGRDLTFTDTSAASSSLDGRPYGGGVGMEGDLLVLTRARFERTQVVTNDTADTTSNPDEFWAYGGGLAALQGTTILREVVFYQTAVSRTERSSRTGGGGVAAVRSAELHMFHVTITDADADVGRALASGKRDTEHCTVRAAILKVEQRDCAARNESIIQRVGSNEMLLRQVTFDTPNCTSIVEPKDALVQCRPWTPSPNEENVCGFAAECINDHEDTHGVSTPRCECPPNTTRPTTTADSEEDPAWYSDDDRDHFAPYIDGCILPLRFESLTRRDDEVTLTLRKTRDLPVPHREVNLTVRVNGTAWGKRNMASDTYEWNVEEATPEPWLHVLDTNGNVSEPRFPGADAEASMRVQIKSKGKREKIDAYSASISVRVQLQPSAQNITIPVSLYVTAEPDPEQCLWQGFYSRSSDADEMSVVVEGGAVVGWEDVRYHEVLGELVRFRFSARDIEGLPLSRGDAQFQHRIRECTDSTCTAFNEAAGRNIAARFLNGQNGTYEAYARILKRKHYRLQVRTIDGVDLPFGPTIRGVCAEGYIETNDTETSRDACQPCPPGVNCTKQTWPHFLETLELQRNYWRLATTTKRVYPCNEDDQFGTRTPCVGGTASSYCADGLQGPLCRLCVAEHHFFDAEASDWCRACSLRGGQIIVAALFVFLAIFMATVGGVALILHASTKHSRGRVYATYAENLLEERGGKAKLKIAAGFIQVIITLPVIFNLPSLPEWYRAFERVLLEPIATIGMLSYRNFGGGNVACLGNYEQQLNYHGVYPLILLLALAPPTVLISGLHRRCTIERRPEHGLPSLDNEDGEDAQDGTFASVEREESRHADDIEDADALPVETHSEQDSARENAALDSDRESATLVDQAGAATFTQQVIHKGVDYLVPLGLYVAFFSVPSRVRAFAPSFNCRAFGYDDVEHPQRYFLRDDYSVECSQSSDGIAFDSRYEGVMASTVGWLVLWVVVIPSGIAIVLFATKMSLFTRPFITWEMLHFLHGDYKPSCYWWDLVELGRKLMLTVVPLFVTPEVSLYYDIRVALAMVVTMAYLLALTLMRPYKESHAASTLGVAVASNVSLACIFVGLALLRANENLERFDPGSRSQEDIDGHGNVIAAVMLTFNLCVVLWTAWALWLSFRDEQASMLALFYQSSGALVQPPRLSSGLRYHVFLSHSWANQDAVAVLKRQLEYLLRGVRVFLDVDMQDTNLVLEDHVASSAVMLILLGSPEYFQSKNCLRELRTARENRLPLILVHDTELQKNGAPLDELKSACPAELHDYVFGQAQGEARQIIPWHRVTEFQVHVVAQVAKELLCHMLPPPSGTETPSVPGMYVPNALAWKTPYFGTGITVYVSSNNRRARAVVDALRAVCGPSSLSVAKALGKGKVGTHDKCRYWLLFLHKEVFKGRQGHSLANEIIAARDQGITIVTVFRPSAGAFDQILSASPRRVREEARLFDILALEWHDRSEIHHPVSVRLVAKALGAELRYSGATHVIRLWALRYTLGWLNPPRPSAVSREELTRSSEGTTVRWSGGPGRDRAMTDVAMNSWWTRMRIMRPLVVGRPREQGVEEIEVAQGGVLKSVGGSTIQLPSMRARQAPGDSRKSIAEGDEEQHTV